MLSALTEQVTGLCISSVGWQSSPSDDRNVLFPNQQAGNATNGRTLFLQVGFHRHGRSYWHGAGEKKLKKRKITRQSMQDTGYVEFLAYFIIVIEH